LVAASQLQACNLIAARERFTISAIVLCFLLQTKETKQKLGQIENETFIRIMVLLLLHGQSSHRRKQY
jgi:hypothetical protein